jgi:hypothetical protein
MKRFAMFCLTMLSLAVVAPPSWGQISPPPGNEKHREHGSAGVFVDYTRFQSQSLNLIGVGGRIGFNVQRHVAIEADLAYDFSRTLTQPLAAGGAANSVNTNVKMFHALFGPKIQTTGRIRYFGFFKAGIVNFGISGPAPAGGINNQLGTILNGDLDKVYYPGGGVEFKIKRVTMRAEAGDELIYFASGPTSITNSPHNNLRATIGPMVRF